MKRFLITIFLILVITFSCFAAEVIRYVDPDSDDGGDGTTWTLAYDSFFDMEAAEDGGTNSGDDLIVYFRALSGGDDTTAVVIDGFTYDSVTFEAASGYEALKTGWQAARYVLDVTDATAITISDSNVTLKGLQIYTTYSASASTRYGVYINGVHTGVNIYNCFIYTDGSGSADKYGIYTNDSPTVNVWNTVVWNYSWRGIRIDGGTWGIYNSIIYDSNLGIQILAGSTVTVKNVAVFGNVDDINDAATSTIDFVASDDGDGTNAVAPSGADWANEYAGYATGDFTLTAGGNCEDGGTDNPGSGLYSTDIEGDSYSTPWSIGVDEIAVLWTEDPAGTFTLADCSQAAFEAVLLEATYGETIIFPAGTATWASEVEITKYVTIQGAGKTSTILQGYAASGTDQHFMSFAPDATSIAAESGDGGMFEVSGIKFDGDWKCGGIELVGGATDALYKNIKIHDNHFFECGNASYAQRGLRVNGRFAGVAYSNDFEDCYVPVSVFGGNWYGFDVTHSLGSDDALYLEDNTFTYNDTQTVSFVFQTGQGGVSAFRYNILTEPQDYDILDIHGNQEEVTAPNDPGGSRAAVFAEIYGNIITTDRASHRFLYHRGNVALVFSNTVTQDGATNCTIVMTEEDDWRFEFVAEPPSYDLVKETYLFNNKVNGSAMPISVYEDGTQAYVGDYIAEGSEYFTSTPIGVNIGATAEAITAGTYSPYTYPHPLRGESAPFVGGSVEIGGLIDGSWFGLIGMVLRMKVVWVWLFVWQYVLWSIAHHHIWRRRK